MLVQGVLLLTALVTCVLAAVIVQIGLLLRIVRRLEAFEVVDFPENPAEEAAIPLSEPPPPVFRSMPDDETPYERTKPWK